MRSSSTPRAATGLLALQRLAGNRAVASLITAGPVPVQRACGCGGSCGCGPEAESSNASAPPSVQRDPLVQRDAMDDPSDLLSAELVRSPRCREAYLNPNRPLREGERSEGVGALQDALLEIGFGKGFKKTEKTGKSDDVYGPETHTAVHVFQKSTSDVRPVGGQQAGRKTLRALDRALGGGGGGTGPVPVPGAPVQLPKKVQGAEEPGSLEQDGKVVEKPKSKAAPTETTPKDADDDNELSGKVTVSIGGQVGFNTAGDAPKGNGPDKPNLICDHGTIQLAGQLNVPWKMNQGNKLKLLPEFDLTADFGGLACGQRPTFGVQVSAFKLQHGKFVELALNAAFQVQGPPTGWIFQAGPELDIHLGTTGFFKHLEIDIAANGGLLLIPRQESRGIGSNFLTGQGALQGVLKYTF